MHYVEMPDGAEILTTQMQGQEHVLWARVNPNALEVGRELHLLQTGDHLPNNNRYISTVQPEPGHVLHVFEPTR